MSSSTDTRALAELGFGEVQGALGLFAEAIAGEPVLFEPDDEHDGWPWQARKLRDSAGRDLAVVAVPLAFAVHASREANRRAARAIVLHQLLANAGRAQIEADLGGERVPAEVELILGFVEDLRVDAETRRRFPGASADLDALLAVARGREVNGAEPVEALRLRSLGGTRADLGARFPTMSPQLLDVLVRETETVCAAEAVPADSLRVARRLRLAISVGVAALPDVGDPEQDPAAAVEAPSESSGGGVPSASATPSDYEEAAGLSHGQAATDGAVATTSDADDEPTTGLTVEAISQRTERAPRSYMYDEWDYLEQRHRAGWCRLVEEALRGDDHEFIRDVRSRHSELRHEIRRSFGRLRPTDLVRVYRCDDGDEVDLDAAIEARVDRRSGAPADDRLHIRRDRGARDVATAFLIDLSASTSAPAVPPEPPEMPPAIDPEEDILSYAPIWGPAPDAEPERRVIDVALDAVALMSDALHELGDRHALYGFSGTGRHGVEFKVAKDFGDRVSPTTWSALAAMKPLRYTRMGPAIRHTAAKLAAQTARTRLLIAISDGYPQDVDYGDDPRDREYGLQDTARALADAARLGIDTFCVTIDPAGHDYLREMMPNDRYLVIDEVEALPKVLPQLYLSLASG